nr:MAG TPA: hypothetical protein [Bacteriophage sp.]
MHHSDFLCIQSDISRCQPITKLAEGTNSLTAYLIAVDLMPTRPHSYAPPQTIVHMVSGLSMTPQNPDHIPFLTACLWVFMFS